MAHARLVIAGCGGRMGRALIQAAVESPRSELVAGFERPGAASVGADLGLLAAGDPVGVSATDDAAAAIAKADVLIDFSTAAAALEHMRLVAEKGRAAVIGATGFSAEAEAEIERLSRTTPIVKASNFSLGVALLAAYVEDAARRLSDEFDIEIFEAHHRAKVDAPSGTALTLGVAAAKGRDVPLNDRAVRVRDGLTGPRRAGDIGFAVSRGGGIIGDHDVSFISGAEVLTLSHRALDRSLFAKGALAAALWVHGKPAGLYGMREVLGLS